MTIASISRSKYLGMRKEVMANPPYAYSDILVAYNEANNAAMATYFYETVCFIGQQPAWGIARGIERSIVYFDTSIIPAGANIILAKLYFTVSQDESDIDFDIVIQNGQPDYPSDEMLPTDYNKALYSGSYGSINTSELASPGYTSCIEFTDISIITKGGITKFILRSSRDINQVCPFNEVYQEEYIIIDCSGYDMYLWIEYELPTIQNIKAEPDSTQTAIKLYGEIIGGEGIIEKGFEYIIQDEEPSAEATGIKVIKEKPTWMEFWEAGEYFAYEYEGNDVDFWDRLYHLSKDEYKYEYHTIWWFRAYFKIGEEKYTATSWMKNVPTVSTSECTDILAQQITARGELINKGANIVTRLGFRIIKEYSGDLMGANEYCNPISDYKVAEKLEEHTVYDSQGIFITGYYWTGIFYRDAIFPKSETPGNFNLGVYSNFLGGGFLGEGFGYFLKPNTVYKIQAIAKNELGVGYGDDIFEVTTGQNFIYEEDEPIISPTSVEKTVTLRDIPEGAIAIRIGIRLGRTKSCNEIDVFMDGEWGNGEKITFFIPDLVPGNKYYEEPYIVLKYEEGWEEEIIDEEEEEFYIEELEDEDLDFKIPDYEITNYKTVIREIRCEKMSDQSFIDKAGRRRGITLNNHLIQSEAVNKEVIDDYLRKFQEIKLKFFIDYDIPIPFERNDVILIGDGKYKFKADGEGMLLFKADGEGEILFRMALLAKIRKVDSNFVSGSELLLGLELEV